MSEKIEPKPSYVINEYNTTKLRRFFGRLGDSALSNIMPVGNDGSPRYPDKEEFEAIFDGCIDLYMQFPPRDRDAEADAFVLTEIMKRPPQERSADTLVDIKALLDDIDADKGSPKVDGLAQYEKAERLLRSNKDSVMVVIGDHIRELMTTEPIDRRVAPSASPLSELRSKYRETVLDLLDEGKINKSRAVGLLLACRVERFATDRQLQRRQRTAMDAALADIQNTLKNRIITSDTPYLKAYVGTTEKTLMTFEQLVRFSRIRNRVDDIDAEKVVIQELTKEIRRYYDSLNIADQDIAESA